jgi:tight adherence protein C
MTLALLGGCGLGLGLWLLARGLWPTRPTLAAQLDVLDATPALATPRPLVRPDPKEATARELAVGRALLAVLDELGISPPAVRADLAVTGRSLEALAARKAIGAVTCALIVPAAIGVLTLTGLQPSLPFGAAATLVAGVVGFILPDVQLRRQAILRRRAFREACAVWLDLVAVSLAGGAGIEEAMTATSATGRGWAFARLRDALELARFTGQAPWVALGQLGEELDVPELRELAASLALAGTQGARVRRSLTAKATSLRKHEVAAAETAAAEVSERLVLPVGLLLLAFVLFLAFPALVRVFTT